MAPCGWTITGCGCGTDCWDKHTPDSRTYAENIATSIMWAATGRQYGLCQITVRPCDRPRLQPEYVTYPLVADALLLDPSVPFGGPYLLDADAVSGCSGMCRCAARCEVALDGPTTKANIVAVTVNGALVDPAAYLVYSGYLLTRVDGQCWPTCGDYSAAVAGFEATYKRGKPIPAAVQSATDRFACELAKACAGGDCRLPNRVRSLTRQGVEVQLVDLTNELGKIRTGIPEVDALIVAENPHGLQQPPMVLTPDLPSPRLVT